jgi:hypothetical protein
MLKFQFLHTASFVYARHDGVYPAGEVWKC